MIHNWFLQRVRYLKKLKGNKRTLHFISVMVKLYNIQNNTLMSSRVLEITRAGTIKLS